MLLRNPNYYPSTNAETLRDIIEAQMKDLPTLPVVVAKILQTASSPTASARHLQALIAVDAGLTAKILRLANSSFYGQSRRITTLSDAVAILGFNTVRNLTLSASMLDSLAPRGAAQVFDWRAYWEHCTAVAACARLLARRKRLPGPAADEAFVAGLLHDIGKLFLGKYCPDLLAEVVLTAETFQITMEEAEWRIMGTTHALLGQQIAERWNFPARLSSAIGAHHQPDGWQEDPTLTYLVHAANVVTQSAGIGAVDPSPLHMSAEVGEWLSLTTIEREDIAGQLHQEMQRTQALLGWAEEEGVLSPPLTAAAPGGEEDADSENFDVDSYVHGCALAMASATTISAVRRRLQESARTLIPIWGSTLFLWDESVDRFVPGQGAGIDVLSKIGEQQIREALMTRVLAPGAGDKGLIKVNAPRILGTLTEGHRFLACALSGGQKTIGFLLLAQSALEEEAPEPRSEAVAILCAHAAAAIQRVQSFRLSVEALSDAIDSRDVNSAGHSRRVRDLALQCAKRMGLSEERTETLEAAALLHDVGKLSIPDRILNKPGRLDPEEFKDIASHAAAGAHLAGHTFGGVMPFILCHHERWDGAGYPAGLRSTQIPVEAQILAVCEAWDVMRTGHSYRPARTPEAARRELEEGSGTQFDPAVVEAFLEIPALP